MISYLQKGDNSKGVVVVAVENIITSFMDYLLWRAVRLFSIRNLYRLFVSTNIDRDTLLGGIKSSLSYQYLSPRPMLVYRG